MSSYRATNDAGLVHRAIPDLSHLVEPIDSVTPRASNPNEGDVGAVVQQIEARGQHRPLVYQKSTREIIAGEHLWRAAKALGDTGLAMVGVDEDDVDAEARMVGDNLPGRRSRDDAAKLADVLGRLQAAGKLESAGYDPGDLDETLALLHPHGAGLGGAGLDLNAEWRGMPEFEQDDQESFQKVVVHFATVEDRDAFALLIDQAMTDRTRSLWYPEAEVGRTAGKAYEAGEPE